MSSKTLFKSGSVNSKVSATDAKTKAGLPAYSLSDKSALAQYAMTGCFNGTFYTTEKEQLDKVIELANKLPAEYVAKLAVFARNKGFMKDMPAVLAAILSVKDVTLLDKVFKKVVDSPKMVRNFVQILRSGAVGRKSLGTRPKKLVQKYLEGLTNDQLFRADVGNDPSLPDIIKMVHPKPVDDERNAMYAYILNKPYDATKLSKLVNQFEFFKKEMNIAAIPDVPFQMLTALPLTDDHWKSIAERATWTQTRMNLNTFTRHGVFKDDKMVKLVASRLKDRDAIKRAKVFPYQLYTTYQNTTDVPAEVREALAVAVEVATENIPELKGKIYIGVDVSGSMTSAITGNRGSVTTRTRNIDVAALMASAILKKNPDAEIMPFDTRLHTNFRFDANNGVFKNAEILARFGGGGTHCALPLADLNKREAKGDLVIIISDNEANVDEGVRGGTETQREWTKWKKANPNAKLVCLNISPSYTAQAKDSESVLNLGGFSDNTFEIVSNFLEMGDSKDAWVKAVEDTIID